MAIGRSQRDRPRAVERRRSALPPLSSVTANDGRIPALDGLRAVSIAFVVLAHLFKNWRAPNGLTLDELRPLGTLGVRIFFVISGFLITTLLVRELASAGRISLPGFYARRTVRIFPACYLYVAVIAVLAANHLVALKPHDLAFATTYTMSYAPSPSWWVAHLWSLSCEEQFYLLWPGVLALGGRRWGERVAWGAVLGAPLLRGVWWAAFPDHRLMIGQAFPTVFDALATGCLCALRTDAWAPWARRLREAHLWLFAILTIALTLVPQDALGPLARRAFRIPFDTTVNTLIACWLLGSVNSAGVVMSRLLNARPMVALGTVSYSLYLWQQLFIGFEGLGALRALAASVAAATTSYVLVERPLLGLRRRLRPDGAKVGR
jgi:peptidoglycan/LPS O-acetylase OafA/YrhL